MRTYCTVAVLVLSYNHEKYIAACLNSILACDYPDLHIWLLDDGSSDGTCAEVQQMAKRHGRITLITQPHSCGRTAANTQRLIDNSQGKYVLFMSGDDMLGPSFPLARTISKLENEEKLSVVIPRLVAVTQDPMQVAPTIYAGQFLSALRSSDPKRLLQDHLYKSVSRVFLQGVVARRSVIVAAGGFDTALLADDYAFVMRLFKHLASSEKQFCFDEESLWLYRVHAKNIHRASMRQFLLIIQVVAKYVPEYCWSHFTWDSMALDTVNDLAWGRQEAERLLGPIATRALMRQVGKATVGAARTRGDRRLLWQIAVDRRVEPLQRAHALIVFARLGWFVDRLWRFGWIFLSIRKGR